MTEYTKTKLAMRADLQKAALAVLKSTNDQALWNKVLRIGLYAFDALAKS